MATKKTEEQEVIIVEALRRETVEVAIIGLSPLIQNRMSEKGLHELLFPAGRKNAAERAANLKHDPMKEYRAAAETMSNGPTALGITSVSFKAAMMEAALDLPGVAKTQVGRLVYVQGEKVPLYGTPKIFMSVVRQAGIQKTPDVRTRPIIPEWACSLRITYIPPLVTERSVLNLLNAAGTTCGVGDWRQQKGKGSYGMFTITTPEDPEWLRLMTDHGRDAQEAALLNPETHDEMTEELLSWFEQERKTRGPDAPRSTKASATNGATLGA